MTNTLLLFLVAIVVVGAASALLYGAWELWRGWRASSNDAYVASVKRDVEAWHRRHGGPRS